MEKEIPDNLLFRMQQFSIFLFNEFHFALKERLNWEDEDYYVRAAGEIKTTSEEKARIWEIWNSVLSEMAHKLSKW